MVKLGTIVVLTMASYLATLALKRVVEVQARQDAANWYSDGTVALANGQPVDAVEAFRHAVAKNRDERSYALSLGTALTAAGQLDAAQRILLTLRTAAPEEPAINLELARLAARRGDVTDALAYYRNALYAVWPTPEGPRAVRDELIRFLLDAGEHDQALPEILASTTDLPETAAAHSQVGAWFSAAGDFRRALDQFRRALRLDASDRPALDGAGLAAFALGDYAGARRYLEGAADVDAVRARAIAAQVLSNDPMMPRIGARERRRRADNALAHVAQRLNQCAVDGQTDDAILTTTIESMRLKMTRVSDLDDIAPALDLVGQVETELSRRCPQTNTPLDQALLLIVRRRTAEPS